MASYTGRVDAAHTNAKTILRTALRTHPVFPPPSSSEDLVKFLKDYEEGLHGSTHFIFHNLTKKFIHDSLPKNYTEENKDRIFPNFKGRVNEIPVSSRKICAQRGRKKKKNGIDWSNIQVDSIQSTK